MLEEPELELRLENPAHGVIDSIHADPAGVDLGQQQFLELLRTEWLHEHVRSGVHADTHLVRGQPTDARIVRIGDLMDALPVRDDEATELELALEDVCDELLVGVHLDRVAHAVLDPVHAGERRHHAADAVSPDRRCVRCQVDRLKLVPAGHHDALIDRVPLLEPRLAHVVSSRGGVVLRVAVAGIVLRGGEHVVGRDRRSPTALETVDDRFHPGHQRGILAEALVGAAPAFVAGDADARAEAPRDAGCAHLLGGRLADFPQERGVTSGTEADVVREDRGAEDVAVAVDGIDAVDDGNAEARAECLFLERVDHVDPGLRRIRRWGRATARKH